MFYKVLLAVLGLCFAFEMKCPEPAQWSMRARLHCPNPSLYCCMLSFDRNTRINIENCSIADFEAPGKRIVIRGNIDSVDCTGDKYQPIKYWTNVSSDCLFLTSTCSSEGQLLYGVHRYHENDTSCTCDQSKGFDFVTRPRNPCCCIPSQEDCSCYKKMVNLTPSPDFICTDETQRVIGEECKEFDITRAGTTKVISPVLPEMNKIHYGHQGNNGRTPVLVAVAVVVVIIIISSVVVGYCRIEYFEKKLVSQKCLEGYDAYFECKVLDENIPVLWMKDEVEISCSEKYKIEKNGRVNRLSVIQTELVDQGEYSIQISNCISKTQLTVNEYFTRTLESQTCLEGLSVHFECEILEDNKPAKWMKDGIEISASEKYIMEINGKLHKLTVNRASLADQGEYSVKINNCIRKSTLKIQDGDTAEERRFIRVFLIGKHGVGKTSLLKRLMREGFNPDEESTDGIDIVVRKCKITTEGKWEILKDSDAKKELVRRIKAVNIQKKREKQIQNRSMNRNSGDLSDIKVFTDDTNIHRIPETDFQDREEDTIRIPVFANESNTPLYDSPEPVTDFKSKGDISSDTKPIQETTSTITEEFSKIISKQLDAFLAEIYTSGMSEDAYYEIGFWDFAGEREYYETHQTFINPNALFLLVADVCDDITKETQDSVLKTVGEYISFWFDTVHSCAITKDVTKNQKLNPPVIVVCTGIDKWECKDKKEIETKKTDFKNTLKMKLETNHRHHVRSICFLSNKEPDEHDFRKLCDDIFEVGKMLETCEEKTPVKWIPLERLLDAIKDAGVNILPWKDMMDISFKCSIESEDDVKSFLEYQHKVGNIIYFEKFQDNIILNQQWLANAFKCLVTKKVNLSLEFSNLWKTLENTGELAESLIEELFKKEPVLQFSEHKTHILNIMETFNIIAKPLDRPDEYYMPCMITKQITLSTLLEMFQVKKGKCTPWLILEFNFMPFVMFNHVLVYLIRKYFICEEKFCDQSAIYHGVAVFYINETKTIQLVACYLQNAIAVQIWNRAETFNLKSTCKAILEDLKAAIQNLAHICTSYTVKAKCSDGNMHIKKGRVTAQYLSRSENDEYYCEEHNERHKMSDLLETWFERCNHCEKKQSVYWCHGCQKSICQYCIIQHTESKAKRFCCLCHVCTKDTSVYWCYDCEKSMCKYCSNQHWSSDDTSYHIGQHVQDTFSMDHSFRTDAERIYDMVVLHDGLLVIVDFDNKQLITSNISGQQQDTVPLPGYPWSLAVVDNNTVSVTLGITVNTITNVAIVNVRERKVIQKIDIKVKCYDIIYRDNQLFVGCDDTIKVMNMSGEVTRTIPVSVMPQYMCAGEAGRIYYTDREKLYCIDTVGNTLFTLTGPDMVVPWGIATDDEGHALVTCSGSNNVLRISSDGKQSQVIITRMYSSHFSYIFYNSMSGSIVIAGGKTVYVYKKV